MSTVESTGWRGVGCARLGRAARSRRRCRTRRRWRPPCSSVLAPSANVTGTVSPSAQPLASAVASETASSSSPGRPPSPTSRRRRPTAARAAGSATVSSLGVAVDRGEAPADADRACRPRAGPPTVDRQSRAEAAAERSGWRSTRSPANDCGRRWLDGDALSEAANTVNRVTTPTPTMSADAVAAVRRGLRMAFCRASDPVSPAAWPAARPGRPATGRATTGTEHDHADQRDHRRPGRRSPATGRRTAPRPRWWRRRGR